MQLQEANVRGANPIRLFELILAIDNIRDVYWASLALSPEANTFEATVQAKAQLLTVAKLLFSSTAQWLNQKMLNCSQALAVAGIGNAVARTATVIESNNRFRHLSFHGRDLLMDSLLGDNLVKAFLQEQTQSYIRRIEEIKQDGKLTQEQEAAVNNHLLTFKHEDDFLAFSFTSPEVHQFMAFSKDFMAKMTAKFNTHDVIRAINAFNEFLAVNETLTMHMLRPEDEIVHLSSLFIEKKYSYPTITQAIGALSKIKPIVSFSLQTCRDFLNGDCCLANKSRFLNTLFDKPNAPVYQTYEGLGLAANAHPLLKDKIFPEMKKQVAASKSQPEMEKQQVSSTRQELQKQLQRYEDCFDRYFQASMRLVMPIDVVKEACQALLGQLNPAKSGVIPHIKATLKQNVHALTSCGDILRSKTITINALRDMTSFIERLQLALKEEQEGVFRFSLPFLTAPPDYKKIMMALIHYFNRCTGSSRLENYCNFQAVLAEIKQIYTQYGLILETEKKASEGHPEALLIEIYRRYTQQVANLGSQRNNVQSASPHEVKS